MKNFAKILCTAVSLILVASPAAEATSYASFLRQYVNQQQQTQPAQPEPSQPVTQPQQPTQHQPVNFWSSRAQSRAALLQNTNTSQPAPTQPAPAPTQPAPTQPAPAPSQPAPAPSQLTAREQQMLNLINRERTERGLRPVQADMRLTRLARLKSQDILTNNYFAHQSPTYGNAFDMFRSENISFLRGGENLSKAGGVEISHLRLMNSTNHRANILNPHYTHVGIGIINNNPSGVIVTQMYIQAP